MSGDKRPTKKPDDAKSAGATNKSREHEGLVNAWGDEQVQSPEEFRAKNQPIKEGNQA